MPVTDEELATLSELNLEWLDLSGSQVTNEGLMTLAKLKGLRRLGLADTSVSDKELEALADLRQLEWLSLSGTRVTDRGLETLAARFKTLRWLNLDGTKVTDQGLTHLEGLDKLEWLYLRNTAVSDEAIEQLKRARPGLEVSRRDPFPLPDVGEFQFAPPRPWNAGIPGWLKWVLTPCGIIVLARLLDMLFRGWSSDQRGGLASGGTTEAQGLAQRSRRFLLLGKDGKGGIMYTEHDPL
jgi:hypothetical protein